MDKRENTRPLTQFLYFIFVVGVVCAVAGKDEGGENESKNIYTFHTANLI